MKSIPISLYITYFVCIVAFFQSCSGLKCYQCDSKHTTLFLKCGKKFVSDSYLNECGSSDVCVEVISKINTDYSEGYYSKKYETISRNCASRDLIISELDYFKSLKKHGLEVEFKICNTDKCNGPYS